LRLRVIVYGLVAACAALVLISRSDGGGSSDSGATTLKGNTVRGEPVTLTVVNGRVDSFEAQVGVSCRFDRVWHGWQWSVQGDFGGEGRTFAYSDSNRFPDGGRVRSVMRGRFIGDGTTTARGTIDTRGTWPGPKVRTPCDSSLTFEASKVDG
jgi:hypothetical protein